MKRLKFFGMRVFLNDDNTLGFDREDIKCDDYKRKYAKDMDTLLYSCEDMAEDEPYYDFYKALCRKEDREKFEKNGLRFDATVIMPGKTASEFKKTAGHFHNNMLAEKHSYPELYQVINGKALFIMQKVRSFDNGQPMQVEDLMLAEVKAGETVVVPPDYGHATVNIGKAPMVFINLISGKCTNFYDSVATSEGMSVFVLDNGRGGYFAVKNKKYVCRMEPRVVLPADCPALSITQGAVMYSEFTARPEKFAYLNDPLQYSPYYMGLFVEKGGNMAPGGKKGISFSG